MEGDGGICGILGRGGRVVNGCGLLMDVGFGDLMLVDEGVTDLVVKDVFSLDGDGEGEGGLMGESGKGEGGGGWWMAVSGRVFWQGVPGGGLGLVVFLSRVR